MEYHIFYINLDKRTDRREQIEYELQRMGLKGERFSAVYHEFGEYGCSVSHYKVLQIAKARGYKNILIFEDDFEFIVSKEVFEQNMEALANVDFDIVMLGYSIQKWEPYSPLLMKVNDATTTSGYIINEKFYDALIDNLKENITKLIQTREHWHYTIDQCWKVLQPTSKWYAFNERIGVQRASFSDIENIYQDYRGV